VADKIRLGANGYFLHALNLDQTKIPQRQCVFSTRIRKRVTRTDSQLSVRRSFLKVFARQDMLLDRSKLSFLMGYAAVERATMVARLREMMLTSERPLLMTRSCRCSIPDAAEPIGSGVAARRRRSSTA
jgi:hypothetical protein